MGIVYENIGILFNNSQLFLIVIKLRSVIIFILYRYKGLLRTSNHAEAWRRRWNELVRMAHFDMFALINELQKKQSKVEIDTEDINRGDPRPRLTNLQQKREQCLQNAIHNRKGKTRLEYLRG